MDIFSKIAKHFGIDDLSVADSPCRHRGAITENGNMKLHLSSAEESGVPSGRIALFIFIVLGFQPRDFHRFLPIVHTSPHGNRSKGTHRIKVHM